MILYILAALGVLFLLLCVMVAGFNVMMWLSAAVPYENARGAIAALPCVVGQGPRGSGQNRGHGANDRAHGSF